MGRTVGNVAESEAGNVAESVVGSMGCSRCSQWPFPMGIPYQPLPPVTLRCLVSVNQ